MTGKSSVSLFLAVVLLMVGCKENNSREVEVGNIAVTMPVERLEEALFACSTEAEVLDFLDKHPALPAVCFPDFNGDRRQLASKLFENISNPALREFKNQLDSLFKDFDQTVARPLEEAFQHLNYYYPDAAVPKIQTMVTGFLGSDLFVSDSLVVIGLDYFGGPTAKFRPDLHTYQLARYRQEYLVPSVMFFKARAYNRLDADDRSLLADMIWYGKNYEFVRYMMPHAADSLILGFSQENLSKAEVSQKDIWAHLASNKLLYEHVEQKKQKYVGERPVTYEIGEDVPGGIGRWVGWRIVNRLFIENPDLTLQQVMANDNARKILEESGYKGQRD